MTSKQTEHPNLQPEPSWSEIHQATTLGPQPTFVTGGDDTDRLRVRYYQTDDRQLVGKAWFGPGAQGPPGHAHGGSISALLDESMGYAGWVADLTVVAAEITIRFLEMLPLDQVVHFEARVVQVDGKKVQTASKVFTPDGTTYSTGTGLFIVVDAEQFRNIIENKSD